VKEILDFIRGHQRFLVTSHARPDGDSIGSSLAMAQVLQALGKSVEIVHADPAPEAYAGLPGIELIQVRDEVAADYDAAIILECNDTARPGLRNLEKNFIINIDHHPHNSGFGNLQYQDQRAAACSELVYRIARGLNAPISADIANNILAAQVSDTGSFQFSGTSPDSFRIAAELLEHGARTEFVAGRLFNSNPFAKILLTGLVLSTIERDASGRLAWVHLTEAMRLSAGADKGDTEGVVNFALSIRGVQAAAFFREDSEVGYRVSLRSKGDIDVGAVAAELGGGGHRNAAGCSVAGPFQQARDIVLAKLVEAVPRA